ncbi:dihydroxyacetone kinase phosphoryl donor subunit DhaM [Cryobacterium sp. 10C3]|uniref:dihydroxyacetone kinase phosphoryl donor subunit DhaM n=1 Tax=Cryobacterium sp. 10C3 TaxID=3048577 RepID=UPI002AB34354|nr:dihydroxyacetone kinase phosphoryl donor subunit DhaM [Cryobacterium sp. 10C3]MDY7556488.1 dihydroxyacetone kinase phosphoryl donor subunit DhaM [Cryobacterium sp. 10C3]
MSDSEPAVPAVLVGLVFVSHSSLIARGLVDLARQMAPTVRMLPAGGTDDDRIGTSFAKVAAGIEAAEAGRGVVVLCDLGSAILTAESALDFLDDDTRSRVVIVDAPLSRAPSPPPSPHRSVATCLPWSLRPGRLGQRTRVRPRPRRRSRPQMPGPVSRGPTRR